MKGVVEEEKCEGWMAGWMDGKSQDGRMTFWTDANSKISADN